MTTIFRGASALLALWVHLTEKRDYLQITDYGVFNYSSLSVFGLEPSGSTGLIIRPLGTGIEIFDWAHDRGVMIDTIGADYGVSVRISRGQFSPDRMCSNVVTRNLSLVYV